MASAFPGLGLGKWEGTEETPDDKPPSVGQRNLKNFNCWVQAFCLVLMKEETFLNVPLIREEITHYQRHGEQDHRRDTVVT